MKNNQYEVNHIEGKIIISKKFAKEAGILGTEAYNIMKQLRQDNPTFQIIQREIKKKAGKRTYGKLSYEVMEEYINAKEGKDSEVLKQFEQVQKMSKIQAGSYAYVKKWFLARYKDEFVTDDTKDEVKTDDVNKETKEESNIVPMAR